jgi:hypothetical protein
LKQKISKKDLWLKIKDYHFDHIVPAHMWDQVAEAFGGADAFTKAFAAKVAKKHGWSTSFALKAVAEYKKFVYLGIVGDRVVTPSKVIDKVWHEHMLFSEAYRNFCKKILHTRFDHYPELMPNEDQTEVFSAQYIYTLELYEKEFNQDVPADVWARPKFKLQEVTGSREAKKKKKKDDEGPDYDLDLGFDDQPPLYALFDSTSVHSSRSTFPGFGGGTSGGGGASDSWKDSYPEPVHFHGSQSHSHVGHDFGHSHGHSDSGHGDGGHGGDSGGGDSGGDGGGGGCSGGCSGGCGGGCGS